MGKTCGLSMTGESWGVKGKHVLSRNGTSGKDKDPATEWVEHVGLD